jgi:adenylate cyclase
VLEGSVRNHGGRMRIAARLIDAESGSHVWAERYDRAFENMFALQDEIALILVTELQVNLTEGEQARLRQSSIRNMEAWTHWVKGLARFNREVLTREGMTTTLMCWQRAAALDPQAAVIQAMLGMLYYIDARFRYWNDRETALAKGTAHVERALASDPESADAWMVQGLLLLMQGRHDEAVAASRLSLAHGPNAADVAAFAAFVLANAGLGPEAAQEIERAITLCPMFPSYYFGHMGLAYREAGRIPEAIAAFEAYDRNNAGRGVTDLVIMNEQLGERETATRWAGRLRSVFPDFTISGWRNTQFRRDQESLERDIASLRAMGLPEE